MSIFQLFRCVVAKKKAKANEVYVDCHTCIHYRIDESGKMFCPTKWEKYSDYSKLKNKTICPYYRERK